jgi:hypothetical protein
MWYQPSAGCSKAVRPPLANGGFFKSTIEVVVELVVFIVFFEVGEDVTGADLGQSLIINVVGLEVASLARRCGGFVYFS